jgi:limonene-1,2-epoxide hydrolase
VTKTQSERNTATVLEFLDAWKACDARAIADYFTEDGVYWNVPQDAVTGKDAIERYMQGIYAQVSAFNFVTSLCIAQGDHVFTERVDYMKINGSPLALKVAGIFEIRDGKIKAWREYYDSAQSSWGDTEDNAARLA